MKVILTRNDLPEEKINLENPSFGDFHGLLEDGSSLKCIDKSLDASDDTVVFIDKGSETILFSDMDE